MRKHAPPWYFIAGAITFVVAYLPAIIVPPAVGEMVPNANRVSAVPLVGPLLAREYLSDYSLTQSGWNFFTIADAVLQMAGQAAMIAGTVVWALGTPAPAPQGSSAGLSLRLDAGPTGMGATLTW